MPKNPEPKKEEPTFENAIERLEAIVEQMESDKMPLEELLVRYEEGVKLVKLCTDKLAAAQKRIEIIARTASGKPQLSEFEPETAADVTSAGNENRQPASANPASGAVAAKEIQAEDVRLF